MPEDRPTAAGDPPNRIILTQSPSRGVAGTALPRGSRIVLVDPADPAVEVRNVAPGFDTAGRADLSFDGRRVLFVGRRATGDSLDVWEVGLEGGAPRRITGCPEDCTRAIYLSTLYTLDAGEPHRRIAFCMGGGVDRRGPSTCAALYTSRMDGSQVRRITYNPYGVADPLLLSDGRLLYAGGRPPEAGGGDTLYTVNTDGTDVSVFTVARQPSALRRTPCETSDGRIVYVESGPDPLQAGGALFEVRLTRPLHTRQPLAPGAGRYRSPSALPDGGLLVSHRPGEGATYGVYRLRPGSDRSLELVYDSPDWHDLRPVAVRPRDLPAGRSSVVDERFGHGYLYCLDSYLTDRDPSEVKSRGKIARVRVRRTAADARGASATPAGEILGEADVREDGSFYLKVPAKTPLQLETLDATGELLQAMENWIWIMPNERRGCIGCHEDREMAPPNRHVQALRGPPHSVGVAEDEKEEPAPGDYSPGSYER